MNFSIKQAGAPIAPAVTEPVSGGPQAANDQVWQPPDDAVLRRRAYFHALDLTKGTSTRPLATDLKA